MTRERPRDQGEPDSGRPELNSPDAKLDSANARREIHSAYFETPRIALSLQIQAFPMTASAG